MEIVSTWLPPYNSASVFLAVFIVFTAFEIVMNTNGFRSNMFQNAVKSREQELDDSMRWGLG